MTYHCLFQEQSTETDHSYKRPSENGTDFLKTQERYQPENHCAMFKRKYRGNQNHYCQHELNRISGVNLTRIRCGNSNLNSNLHRIQLSDSPVCEDEQHYFMHCPKYKTLRRNVVTTIPLEAWNMNTILRGSTRYTPEMNKEISLTTQKFIMASKRF